MKTTCCLAVLGVVFCASAFADEPMKPPQNVLASKTVMTAGDAHQKVYLSWDAVTNATSYEIWGKISDPALLNFVQGAYTGYQYYPAFGEARQRYVLVGTTTGTDFNLIPHKSAYSSYMAYTEYNEYSPYGCYRIVALSTTLPTVGFDVSPHRSAPSAEVHPAINSDDLNPPGYLTVQPHSTAGTLTLRWDASSGATHYEVYRKRQRRFTGVLAATAHANAAVLVNVDWRHDANEGSAFHPYSAYGAYNAFLVSSPYVEYIFEAATTGTNIDLAYSGMASLGAYHEYSSYATYGGYNAYSNYTEYGVFKVVAINMTTTRRSPASAESMIYNATTTPAASSKTSSGTCFLTAVKRDPRD